MAAKDSTNRLSFGDLLRWRGMVSNATPQARAAAIGFQAILACAMVATQTNYFTIGNAHLIAVLAPITSGALLYGPIASTLIGAVAGLTEMIHALYLPLDAYEAYFAAPTNSILLFALVGLLMGMTFAFTSSLEYKSDRGRMLALVVSCILGSALFSILFSVSVNAINALLHFRIPSQLLQDLSGNQELIPQIVANAMLMVGLSMVAAIRINKEQASESETTLRKTFQNWLAVVVSVAYLITASLSYTFISAACLNNAERQIQGHVDYVAGQAQRLDQIVEDTARKTVISHAKLQEIHDGSIGSVATKLPLGERGVAALAEDGIIVSSNDESYVGQSFEDIVGSGLSGGFDESLYDRPSVTQWFMDGSELGYLKVVQIGYVRITRSGDYQIMAALPAQEVFAWRMWLMLGVSVIFVALFTAVYAQASLLLKNVVVRGIDETNKTLRLITDGDLNQRVAVRDSIEFVSLSAGINATVSALKNAIAAEAGRFERDLATAKAIQESALPQTFPPFPEVSAFDIYANMTAAREVGGDFYDFFLVDDHTLGFLIADVSGKGIPASLFMMAAKTELANYMSSGMSLADAITTANWHLCQGNEAGMFVTVWAALLDFETGELTYVNAGHNPPLLRRNGSWEWLRTRGGLFLGTFDSAMYRSSTLTLGPGDELLLYTDGVNEAFNAREEQYGDMRLEEFLSHNADLHPRNLVDALQGDLRNWSEGAEQSDDITMLSLEYGVSPEVRGSITVDATLDNLDEVLDMVHIELANRKCPIATQNQLDVAIEEMFVNVCRYAYAGQDEPGKCRIEYVYNANPHSITIQLTDWGVPFDPLAHQDPSKPSSIQETMIGGLGIMMAKRMTDDMSYMRDGDANILAFRKSW